jgi:uncharacterized membrane protein (UPF0127 family)
MTAMCRATRPESSRLPALPLVLLALLLAWASIPRAFAQAGQLEELASFPTVKLEIETGKKKSLLFDVWVASTPSRQAQGLMFVRSLPPMRGMLFVHQSPKQITMWMKNTYIPLDMVFIDEGRIREIVEHTTPHSLDIIRSKQPAIAVLEIAAGEAKRLGLKPGQRVNYPPDAGK